MICRLEEHTAAVFGSPDPLNLTSSNEPSTAIDTDANDFPEPEIDAKRAEKDAELAKYVQVMILISS